jgi:hypothetical protein
MFALSRLLPAASHTQRRRRYRPEVALLEERTTLSAAAGVHAAVAPAVHATAVVQLTGHPRHGTHVKFPGGSVGSVPGGHTTVKFPGGMVNSLPGSTVVTFPGGSVNSSAGGMVIRFPGGSIVID